jgi:hypothetical protein
VLSNRTILTFDINSSLYCLRGLATTTLSLHLSVDTDSTRDALTTAHIDGVVLSRFAELTVVLDRNSASKVGAHSTTSNDFWSLTLDNASVFASVDELFWTLFVEYSSCGEAFGVDVSLALLASTSDALVLDSAPRVAY